MNLFNKKGVYFMEPEFNGFEQSSDKFGGFLEFGETQSSSIKQVHVLNWDHTIIVLYFKSYSETVGSLI